MLQRLAEQTQKQKKDLENQKSQFLDEKTLKYQYIELENKEILCYRKFGKGPRYFIFIHGNLSTQHIWDPLHYYLKDNQEYSFITLDLRGFGRSTYNNRIYFLNDFVLDLHSFYKAMDIETAILVGLSMGGAIAINFAINYPSMTEKIVNLCGMSINGYPPYTQKNKFNDQPERITDFEKVEKKSLKIEKNIQDRNKDFLRIYYTAIMTRSKTKITQKSMEKLIDEAFLQRNYTHCMTAMHFFNIGDIGTNEIKKLNVPVMIYHGDNDILIPHEVAKNNYKQIGKRKSILIIKKQAGHAITYEFPKDFSRSILTFSTIKFKHLRNGTQDQFTYGNL